MNYPSDKDKDYLARIIEQLDKGDYDTSEPQSEEVRDVIAISNMASQLVTPKVDKDVLFSKIESKIDLSQPKAKSNFSMKYFLLLTIAAAIGLIALFILLGGSETVVETDYGKRMKYTLPDNSTINLNNNSTVYFEDYSHKRVINLDGEAFFDVKKGSAFEVQTSNGTVEVLGTSFEVTSREKLFSVVCKTGKVKVVINQKTFILEPGQQIRSYYDEEVLKSNIDVNNIASWQKGVYDFEKVPLGVVTESLKNCYKLDIEINENELLEEFTGSFVNDDIDKALKMVFLPMGLQFDKTGNKIVVR